MGVNSGGGNDGDGREGVEREREVSRQGGPATRQGMLATESASWGREVERKRWVGRCNGVRESHLEVKVAAFPHGDFPDVYKTGHPIVIFCYF